MALASKRMSGGACRVWMLTGSRAQCPTTLAGLGLPLVPGLFPSPLVFTHPNLLRCRSLYLIIWWKHPKLQAVPHSSPATTPLSVSTPPYRQNGGSGDTSRPPLSPQQVTEESTKYLMLLYHRLVPQCHTQKERAGWVLMDRFWQKKETENDSILPSGLQAWPALSSQRGVDSNPGPVSNLLMPEFWCSIGYFELDTQVTIIRNLCAISSVCLETCWTLQLYSIQSNF